MTLKPEQVFFVGSAIQPANKSTRSTLPVLSMTKIQAKDGTFTATATDLDAWGEASCECVGNLEPVCVPFRLFDHLIRAHGGAELTLLKNGRLLCVYDENRLELATLPATDFPVSPAVDGTGIGVNTLDLAEAMDAVAWAASGNDPTIAGPLTGAIHINIEPNLTTVCAGDKHTFAIHRRSAIGATAELLIPAAYVSGLNQVMCQNGATLSQTKNHLIAKTDKQWFAVRLMEGPYYPVKVLLAKKPTFLGLLDIAPLRQAIGLTKSFIKEPWAESTLTFNGNLLSYDCQSLAHSFHTQIPFVSQHPEPAAVRLDAFRLGDALKNTNSPEAKISVLPNALVIEVGDLFVSVALIIGKKEKAA